MCTTGPQRRMTHDAYDNMSGGREALAREVMTWPLTSLHLNNRPNPVGAPHRRPQNPNIQIGYQFYLITPNFPLRIFESIWLEEVILRFKIAKKLSF
ncbi:hypothetical protein QQP08_004236 [Theobroma cacao]|nr:hypothetical protein QQP08_004236 [Theobroma cacao]